MIDDIFENQAEGVRRVQDLEGSNEDVMSNTESGEGDLSLRHIDHTHLVTRRRGLRVSQTISQDEDEELEFATHFR